MSHGGRLRVVWQLRAPAVAPEELLDAPVAWQQLGLAHEKSLLAPQVERPLALE
jgi:hypothetical protein